jgi:aryl-alcohol dehydrogenase-like predicted oxidoreductase
MVSLVGLGCNNFGGRLGPTESEQVVHCALDSGITLFDTADIYASGQSETILGRLLGPRRKDVVLATKFGLPMDGEGRLQGASRDYVTKAAEASLRRLGTEWIDLYYLHMPDPDTPIEETLEALDRLRTAGKIRFIGCSNMPPRDIAHSRKIARDNGFEGFICSQDEYSLVERQIEHELIPTLRKQSMGLLPYFPLASGLLSGKYDAGLVSLPEGSRFATSPDLTEKFRNHAILTQVAELKAFSKSRGRTLLELAFSWLASCDVVSSVIAGASSAEQVRQNVRACNWRLTYEDAAAVRQILDKS